MPHEVVVADDASDDGSVEQLLRRFPRVRVVRHDERQGAAPAKALGAKHARGDVLIFLDGHCLPERGTIGRLVEDVELLKGRIPHKIRNRSTSPGHPQSDGYGSA